ncbi:hypothetical protein J2Z31_005221 [Sinorhizobium kostiense]|uniref:Uncharacterized protein n=1 Tax=Sinorhizobium kostiense TaxID=76747 RepID=A0ABS4R8M7_9HYPH|nr:hypothetical protein [Sinorhizobium kostiense]
MATCYNCGGKIVFRYLGGSPVPIHTDGGWCSSLQGNQASSKPAAFETTVSYVNPNAECPVCHERVYYYQSPFGGRVFFDDLGWPWPKHSCTDNRESQTRAVKTITSSIHTTFRNKQGEQLDLYKLVSLSDRGLTVEMRFRIMRGDRSFSGAISKPELKRQDITVDDLKVAPSFVVRKYPTFRLLEFISARKQCIDLLKLPRLQQ